MSDLTTRLRAEKTMQSFQNSEGHWLDCEVDHPLCAEAAEEIERLERHVEFRDKIIKKHEKDNAELKHDLSVYKSIEEFEDEAERRD